MGKNLYPSDSDRYKHLEVTENAPLLEWLIRNSRESRNKIKSILRNRGIKVNKRVVTQFDYQLNVGDKVSISKTISSEVGTSDWSMRTASWWLLKNSQECFRWPPDIRRST